MKIPQVCNTDFVCSQPLAFQLSTYALSMSLLLLPVTKTFQLQYIAQ
jgi:hypothetical protein